MMFLGVIDGSAKLMEPTYDCPTLTNSSNPMSLTRIISILYPYPF